MPWSALPSHLHTTAWSMVTSPSCHTENHPRPAEYRETIENVCLWFGNILNMYISCCIDLIGREAAGLQMYSTTLLPSLPAQFTVCSFSSPVWTTVSVGLKVVGVLRLFDYFLLGIFPTRPRQLSNLIRTGKTPEKFLKRFSERSFFSISSEL